MNLITIDVSPSLIRDLIIAAASPLIFSIVVTISL